MLDIEHRWGTKSYSFRHFENFLAIIFCNAIDAHIYFNLNGNGDWTTEARRLAYRLMHNTWDRDHCPRGTPRVEPLSPDAPSPGPSRGRQPQHTLVRLRAIEGYIGKGQAKCGECGRDTGWACLQCSTAEVVVCVHPAECLYRQASHSFDCLRKHRRCPEKTRRTRPRGPSGPRNRHGDDGDDDDD